MTSNIIIALNVVLPLFLCIALGYGLRRIRMVDEPALNTMNKLVFKVFLPLLLFHNVYTTDLSEAFNGRLILFEVGAVVLWFLFLMIVIPRIEKENSRRGVLVQAIFRSNFVLFGLPVAANLCGEENIGVTSLLVGIVVPVFNVLAVVSLEFFRGGKVNIKKVLKGIATNPLILASLLGVIFYFLHIRLPQFLEKTVQDLSKVATPLSLVVLGAFFTFGTIRGYARQLLLGVAGKLIIWPLIVIPIAILMGFRDVELASLMILLGSPTAVSSFTMAQQMDGDGDLAAELVVFTTGISIITIFLWIVVLKSLGVI